MKNQYDKKIEASEKLIRETGQARERHKLLSQEKAILRTQDAKRNLSQQKWQRQQQKLKILDKHRGIEERLNTLK